MSGTVWNPNNPAVSGLEWYPTRQLRKLIGYGAGVGAKVHSTAAETIAEIHAFVNSDTPGVQAQIGLDIYDATALWAPNEIVGALSLPSENADNTPGFTEATSGVEQPYDSAGHGYIDNLSTEDAAGILTPTASVTRVHYEPTGGRQGGHITYRAAATYTDVTGAGATVTPAGKRIAYLEVVHVMHGGGTSPATVDGILLMSGTQYGSPTGPIAVVTGIFFTRYVFRWYFNPATGEQWLPTDLAQFQTGGLGGFGANFAGSAGADVSIAAVNLVIRYLPERRLATGYALVNATGLWRPFTLEDPTTGSAAPWAKASGTDYLFEFYATPFFPAGGSIVGVDSANLAGHENDQLTGWQGLTQPFVKPVIPSADPSLSAWVPALYMMTSAPALGVDAQPYVTPTDLAVTTAGVDKQGIAAHNTLTYGGGSVVVAPFNGVIPDGPLIMRMRAVSGGAQVGGDLTIDPSEIPQDGKYHLITDRFAASAALATATAYLIQFSTTGTIPWPLRTCYTRDPAIGPTTQDTTAAGGSIAGAGTLNGTADPTLDWLTNVSTVPAPPGTLTAVEGHIANQPALAGTHFLPGSNAPLPTRINYAHLGWVATSLAATFGYYEVQRQERGIWYPIAYITLEASNYFYDLTSGRTVVGFSVPYRVRVVRLDGAVSDWAPFPTVLIHVQDCGDVVISTNAFPDLSLAFQELGGTSSWDQLQTARVKIQPIYGRDDPILFAPAEAGGEQFTRQLAIALNDSAVVPGGAVTPGRGVFDPLIALLQNRGLPALTYADGNGRVWYVGATIQSPGPTRVEPGGAYTANVQFTTIATVPPALVYSTPPVP